jgi:hypothetical protein
LEPETVDAEGYVDKFIDQSGIIPDMNERYGSKQWTYLRDRASVRTAAATMTDLMMMLSVRLRWPAGSPDRRIAGSELD